MMNVRKIAILFWLFVASLGTTALAQDQKQTAPPDQHQASEAQAEPRGSAQQVVHESRESAGEETDETAQFKQSAAVKLIARVTGLSLGSAYWLSVGLNFAVIAGIIFWAARKALPGAFRDRTASIQKAMQEAQKASAEARSRLAEIEARLAKLDTEIATMRDAAEREAAAEEARIKAAAEEDARKIVQSAEQEIAAAIKTARRELTAFAADLAVALAQKQIHVDASTDQAIVHNFAGQLGSAPGGPGGTSGTGKGGH
jgi:F-type H+-transporting ATPase subunit b